ncbi:MAG: ClpX C4-type zinc finger protein [Archangium sp.]|nr:ClpX C4-type zinc finger protein [Archangium sp.]
MSDIRRLLSDAQDAERRGKKEEAVRLLRVAAAWYRDRQMLRRAAQMLRQARRVEGVEEEEPGDAVVAEGEFDGPVPELSEGRVLLEQRVPQLADPALDAWCSFCCRPAAEVGPLVAGPAGAYVCDECVSTSAGLLDPVRSPHLESRGPTSTWEIKALSFELPSQRRARMRLTRSRSRLALVIGPEGTGKSAWLESLGAQPDLRHLEVAGPLTADDEEELLRWLDSPARSAFLVVRAPVPPPALVLQGEHGEEPLHDTASLVGAVPHVSARVLARVDAVIPFEPPHPEELASLAQAIAEARGVWLPDSALAQLVSLALRAQRGAHELATLIARIPPGKYT